MRRIVPVIFEEFLLFYGVVALINTEPTEITERI